MQTSAYKVAIHQVPGKDAVRGCGLISDKCSTNTSHSRLPYRGPEPFLRLIHADGRVPLCSHRRRLALFGRRFAAPRFIAKFSRVSNPQASFCHASRSYLAIFFLQKAIISRERERQRQRQRQRQRETDRDRETQRERAFVSLCVCVRVCESV